MNKNAMKALVTATGIALASAASAQENTFKLGAVVNPIAAGFTAEYERLLGRSVSLGIRYASISYEWEEDDEIEEGDVKGFDLTFRHYWGGRGFRGWYWGAAVGRYESEWDWREGNLRGSGTTDSTHVQAMVGYKHFFNDNFYVDGYGMIGNWSGTSKSTSGSSRETEIGAYFAVGVGLGLAF